MNNQDEVRGWEKEFAQRTTKESFLAGDSLYEEFTYPESKYELDPDKVKDFIRTLLAKKREQIKDLPNIEVATVKGNQEVKVELNAKSTSAVIKILS